MIYIMGTNPAGPIKLGRSKNPVKRRVYHQTSNPQPFIIFGMGHAVREAWDSEAEGSHLELVPMPDSIGEKALKFIWRDLKVRGEWYNISAIDALYETMDSFPAVPNSVSIYDIEFVLWETSCWLEHDKYLELSVDEDN